MAREGWRIFPYDNEEQCAVALYDAARFGSGLQMISYRSNAFDVQLVNTRRVLCSGFIMRSFSEFLSQLTGFIVPKVPDFSDKVPGSISLMPRGQGPDGSS